MQFTSQDETDLAARGLTTADVAAQVFRFIHETTPLRLERPCTPGDGILLLNAAESHRLFGVFESERANYTLEKFVPASGAATRMFKHLFNYSPDSVGPLTEEFILNFLRFPFIPALRQLLDARGEVLDQWVNDNRWKELFDLILGEHGLNYGQYPKGLIPFHCYPDHCATAFEEHIRESLLYSRDGMGTSRVHFTLAPAHSGMVTDFIDHFIESTFPYEDIRYSWSVQSEQSDTPALDRNDDLVRDSQGRIMFRPAGHGALIHNLSQLDGDILFIKNIDNVTTSGYIEETVFYKKILAGLLIHLRNQSHRLLERLEENPNDRSAIGDAIEFIQLWFQHGLPLGMSGEELARYAVMRLDRPLRICGMVRNEGEPGGGPFWVRMPDGHISKQIVEKSQVDISDLQQSRLLSESTHFNPVDIVCSIRDRHGVKYALDNYIDHSTGFVSEKFHEGQVIKALELPGLWNGSMALWNTVFVEVPVTTFNPVKTVNDLLRPGHQVG